MCILFVRAYLLKKKHLQMFAVSSVFDYRHVTWLLVHLKPETLEKTSEKCLNPEKSQMQYDKLKQILLIFEFIYANFKQ